MATRTAKLASRIPAAATTTTVGTVPTGVTWIIKSVLITNNGGASVTASVWAQDVAGTLTTIFSSVSIAANGRVEWDGFMVLVPSDILVISTSGSAVSFWISGSKLAGVAA